MTWDKVSSFILSHIKIEDRNKTEDRSKITDLRSSSEKEKEKTPAPSGYNKLAKVIEQALKDKFTETNEQMLSMMTDSSPKFIWS